MSDLVILYSLPLIASALSIIFNLPWFYSNLLFMGLPSLYLTFKSKKNIFRIALFSLLFSLPLTLLIDYIMQVSKVWGVATIFSFKIFGAVSIEMFFWGFLYIYLSVIYYKYFLDKKSKKYIGFRDKILAISSLVWILGIIAVLLLLLSIGVIVPYLYFISGILVYILQIVIFAKLHPNLVHKFFRTIPYNFIVAIFFEVTEIYLKQWFWPGKYVGWVQLLGQAFPIEEFVFYMILGSVGVLMYFELLADDLE